ncbi:MAG: FAD-dependent oxidoreductase [Phycisphaerae bacterium]|nr:FAD-dependent oxidoreductase [Phycisphaerae bacterium]
MGESAKIGSVMVVGGGIAGIQASLDLADSGYKVYLIESSTAIGGRMAQLDKTFPTNDCAMCTISPRLVAAGTHRNIEIITNAEVSQLTGQAGNFQATITQRPSFVNLEKCTGCGICGENCPVPVKDEYNQLLGDRRVIFKKYPQAVPNKFAMTRLGWAPCYDACPIHANPSGYVALTAASRFQEAYESATANNPFPGICGRICEHPCEQACNRGNLDDPIAIAYVKRFLSDWYAEHGEKPTPEQKRASITENGRRIAVIGSGPAGLAAALDLRKMGYAVTIFEKHGVLGGMMRIGIPVYRLPTEVIDRDIQNILDYGIEVRRHSHIQHQEDIQALFEEGFEAVFLSVGSHKSARMGLAGEDFENVSHGIDFLRDVRLGKRTSVKASVIVVGGGNVAMDCARTSMRLGAKKVSIVCLESRDKMPAYPWEIEWAEQEGVEVLAAKAAKRIVGDGNAFAGLELLDVRRMAFVDGRLELETIEGSERTVAADELIVSIGQKPELGLLAEGGKIKLTRRGTVEVDAQNGMTTWQGVFVGGDVVRGAASVVQATADGQFAARAIDAWLRGVELPPEEKQPVAEISREELKERKAKVIRRRQMPTIDLQRRRSFEEVDLGFAEETAVAEASRCLYCAVCSSCGLCEKLCEAEAIQYNDKPEERTLDVGALILAPGFDVYDAARKGEYGYRRFPNVVSGLDCERLLSASGPTMGHLRRPSDGEEPRRIAFIQCVGSRDTENPYCSSVCCMYAVKQAVVIAEHVPETQVKVFAMDVRAFGKGFDEYYERSKDKYGVQYIYTRPSAVRQDFKTYNLTIEYSADGKNWVEEEFDMVILSSGLCPAEGTAQLADVCGIELNAYRFARSAGYFPTKSSRDGVYLAGAFESPKDIPESVTQATGAAAAAMELLEEVRGTQVADKHYPDERNVFGMVPRIGVFVCHCGSNIGGVIDCRKIAADAAGLPNVVFATDLLYTCSPDGLRAIKENIKKYDVNRVVVASCTPRTHEPLFQEAVREVGLNPYLFEMANIRDQCTWVHTRLGDLTEKKAVDLVKMAVGRAATIEPLQTRTYVPKKSAVVVGGGVGGITAALSIANQGYGVHLLEKTDRLGGNVRNVRKVLDESDPQLLLAGLIKQVRENENIQVHYGATLKECKGFIGDFKSVVQLEGPGPKVLELEHGAAIVATGANEAKPREYLYGDNNCVMTQLELENRLCDDPSYAEKLQEVVMIQCVGSRDSDRMICSRVCCTVAVKNAAAIKCANPQATVAVLYRDIRTYGFREDYYNEARGLGVLFFRYDLDSKPVVAADASGRLEVKVRDLNSQLTLRFDPDVLALSAAMIPQPDNEKVGMAFKVPVTREGFFLEAHMKLRPVDFASDGLFLCGTCHAPKFIDETITQAQAAAAKVVSILSRPVMEVSGIVSVVDRDRCAACLTCVRTCPYDVPRIDTDGVAVIEAAMCHGCGICASECPAKAISLMHYKDAQVIAKTDALFDTKSELVKND